MITAQTLPYLLIYLFALIISLVVLIYTWRNRSGAGVRAFAISVALEISWLIGYVIEINSSTLEAKVFWDNFQYIGALFAPVALLIFALQFSGWKINTRRLSIILSVIPLFTLVAIYANLWPDLIRIDTQVLSGTPYDELTYGFGTIAAIGNYYLYLLSLVYIIALFVGFRKKKGSSRRQHGLVTFGTSIPIIGLILAFSLGFKFANQRDVSPLMFVVSNAVIAFGVFRYRLFSLLPLAREALFETIEDVLIILDVESNIVDANLPARTLLSAARPNPIGIHISAVFPELYEQFEDVTEARTEIEGNNGEVYDLKITPLHDRNGQYLGRLINAHDITSQKNAEKELKASNEENVERAELFQNVAEISRIITSFKEMSSLFAELPELISQQFNVYHVSIFLLDEKKEFAVLQASNSEGGQRMLARNHQLRVGSVSMVGYATSRGEARIAQDVAAEEAFYNNPDLPETRSALTIPLKVAGEIIGALDIQTKETNAFDELSIRVGMLLADMVAISIQNARLYEENVQALKAAEDANRQLSGEAWSEVFKTRPIKGYIYDGIKSQPLTNTAQDSHSISIPVQVRGQEIGSLKLQPTDSNRQWTEDELAVLTAAAERAALALENARLIRDAQRRATRERIISDISTNITMSSDLEVILRTAVQSLGRTMGGAEVTLEINPETEES